jgi:hypothetical protein
MTFAGIAGVFGALLLVSIIDPQGSAAMDAMILLVGAFVGVAVDYWVRG